MIFVCAYGNAISSQADAVLAEVSICLDSDSLSAVLISNVRISSGHARKRSGMSPKELAKNWGISIERARKTIELTTQRMRRSGTSNLVRRQKTKNAEVLLPHLGENVTGTVKRRKRNSDGNLIGKSNDNPILDTREYIVEFPDGREAELSMV